MFLKIFVFSAASPKGLKRCFYGHRHHDRDGLILDELSPSSRRAIASLYTTLYDDYLCLVASNKQQIQW